MLSPRIPGIGDISGARPGDLLDLEVAVDGMWRVGRDGVLRILTPRDRKVEFLVFADKTVACVKSALGPPAFYPLAEDQFEAPAEAVLMDLDGTSVRSESFWMWIVERSTAELMGAPGFRLQSEDAPMVSGHSVSEHLQYCIRKYCPDRRLDEARRCYYEITRREMQEILEGRGRYAAFQPSAGLKEFLLTLKSRGVRIGLVTSGLYDKAWPEVVSAFRSMKLGDPLEFYDAIITAGQRLTRGQAGTLGELSPKPHPWLYAETAYVGLGIDRGRRHRVVGIEDSAAGVVAIRLAGFAAIGIAGGNIEAGGVRPLLRAECEDLLSALPVILGD
jgi:beta-phosphoglucomutase-like phosphatase (HAD superfamily)